MPKGSGSTTVKVKRESTTRHGGKKQFSKTDMSRREYKLRKQQQKYDYQRGLSKEAQKTKRVEAIATNAQLATQGISAAATAGSSVTASEATKREQLKLISPIIQQGDDAQNSATVEEDVATGNIPFI